METKKANVCTAKTPIILRVREKKHTKHTPINLEIWDALHVFIPKCTSCKQCLSVRYRVTMHIFTNSVFGSTPVFTFYRHKCDFGLPHGFSYGTNITIKAIEMWQILLNRGLWTRIWGQPVLTLHMITILHSFVCVQSVRVYQFHGKEASFSAQHDPIVKPIKIIHHEMLSELIYERIILKYNHMLIC